MQHPPAVAGFMHNVDWTLLELLPLGGTPGWAGCVSVSVGHREAVHGGSAILRLVPGTGGTACAGWACPSG